VEDVSRNMNDMEMHIRDFGRVMAKAIEVIVDISNTAGPIERDETANEDLKQTVSEMAEFFEGIIDEFESFENDAVDYYRQIKRLS